MPSKLRYEDPDFFLGNLGRDEIDNSIISSIEKSNPDFHIGGVVGVDEPRLNVNSRDCLTGWIKTSEVNFIEQGMRKIIHNVNALLWKYDLKGEWQTDIQITKYSKVGHHYTWHPDNSKDDPRGKDLGRVITLVYCLARTEDYEGGEFDLRKPNNKTASMKFDRGDFIVFPSHLWHRVRPLKGGERTTLVGWYS
ncbi:2OG-Fe(II) oxygenase [Synechococcus phage S-N03]|uniref:2OG-Fe(II) oxygenase n=1 Tax=Synechococcus phage S-N03 TaxID=2718943 RepID=A0A6G8R5P3_9CAUD|nr:2OG-Fe(II) oxygenase [Synechococcus phage S-N03]QIN96706.1 2OG-Fe(II) oxygenase [Synechococcus phage S-N03]